MGTGKMLLRRRTEPALTGLAAAALIDGESGRFHGGPAMSADYEVEVLRLPDNHGGELRVVRHWSDGIMMLDPVKVMVYDAAGKVLAETPYLRAAAVRRRGDG